MEETTDNKEEVVNDNANSTSLVKHEARPISNDIVTYFTNDYESIMAFARNMAVSKYADKLKGKDGKVSPEDVVACILTGREVGMSPMQSLLLGDKLTNDGYLAIVKGQNFGLDPVTSTENIHIIPTPAGRATFLGIHIVTKVLIENNIDIEIVADFKPLYQYSLIKGGTLNRDDVEAGTGKVKDKYYVYTVNVTTNDELTAAKTAGKTIITRTELCKHSAVRLSRVGRSPVYYSFSVQDAIDEAVYPGTTTYGVVIDAENKTTYIRHLRSKLLKTAISRAARLIADDLLEGSYSNAEIAQFIANKSVNPRDTVVAQIIDIDSREEV